MDRRRRPVRLVIVGAPAVLLASAAAAAVIDPPRRSVRPLPLLRFVGFFAVESVKGGLGVARIALARELRLAAGFVTLRTSLPEGAPRVLFADTLSLLPGTLTVDVVGDEVLVHGLDAGPALTADARRLERRVAELFGLPPPTSHGGAA